MKKGNESVSFLTGLIIALLILTSLTFISCSIAKQQADVRNRINFDRVSTYFTQCAALERKDCYCDLPITVEASALDESLSLTTRADGLYLELKNDKEKILQSKKLSDKSFCAYTYSSTTDTWSSRPASSYSFSKNGQSFILHKLADGSLCRLEGYTSQFTPDASSAVLSHLHSCSTEAASQITFFLQQRYPPNLVSENDFKKHSLLGKEFMDLLQSSFAPKGNLFVSHITPKVIDPEYMQGGASSSIDYSSPQDDTPLVFHEVASHVRHTYKDNFILLSPEIYSALFTAKKDTVLLSYYEGSPKSKLLADAIEKRLQELNGHSYKDEVILSDVDKDYTSYLFSFDFHKRTFTDSSLNQQDCSLADIPLYCEDWAKQESPSFYEQRTEIPALAITFIDSYNSYSLYDHHLSVLSQALFLGVQDYLQQQAASQNKAVPGNIFDRP